MTGEPDKNVFQSALDILLRPITACVNHALLIIMGAMALVLGANITLRYLFESPIPWSNAISRYAYIYIVLLGTAISYIEGSHAQIDFVYQAASKRTRAVFDLLHHLFMMVLCIIMLVFGTRHVITMWPAHSPVLTTVSMGAVYLSVPISAGVIAIFLLRHILGNGRIFSRGEGISNSNGGAP